MLQVADISNGGYLLGELEEIFCHESTNNCHQKDVSGFITFPSPRREPHCTLVVRGGNCTGCGDLVLVAGVVKHLPNEGRIADYYSRRAIIAS